MPAHAPVGFPTEGTHTELLVGLEPAGNAAQCIAETGTLEGSRECSHRAPQHTGETRPEGITTGCSTRHPPSSCRGCMPRPYTLGTGKHRKKQKGQCAEGRGNQGAATRDMWLSYADGRAAPACRAQVQRACRGRSMPCHTVPIKPASRAMSSRLNALIMLT